MDKLYTIQEIATKLNLSDKTLRRWEEAGRFTPSRTLGNQRRYSIEDLQILDAIKHGTINEQKDLLNIDQASKLCGVSPTTLTRWEETGKIHPFITSGNTYYPRVRLIEKMDELKKIYVEEPQVPSPPRVVEQPVQKVLPKLQLTPLELHQPLHPYITQALITLALILCYHLIFATPSANPFSPQPIATSSSLADPSLDLLRTMLDPTGALITTTLTAKIGLTTPTLSLIPSSVPAKPLPGTIYYDADSGLRVYKSSGWSDLSQLTTVKLDGASLVSSTAVLSKGKNQVSVSNEKILRETPITVTFSSDYAPAKKYWITVDPGSFTLHTDFPVSADSPFSYNFLVATSTVSATPKF